MQDYAYGGVIIEEAYDVSGKATSELSFPYIDSILTSWHEAGCKTLEECKAREAMHKQANSTKNANKTSQKSKKTVEAETPKYTDFNSEDALMRALERSYGDSDS
jgi:DNA replication protein DnaD